MLIHSILPFSWMDQLLFLHIDAISWAIPEHSAGAGSSQRQPQPHHPHQYHQAVMKFRLVNTAFDAQALELQKKHGLTWQGTAVSSQLIVKLLVQKCGFVLVSAQQQQPQGQPPLPMNDNETRTSTAAYPPPSTTTTIFELSHPYFCAGRIDWIARMRFSSGSARKQQPVPHLEQSHDKNDDHFLDAARMMMPWPSGARLSASIHLADERQYQSLLKKKNSDKLWPEAVDNDDKVVDLDDNDSDSASLEDDELDATWEQEVSDGIDPIRFSADQQTQVLPSHPATRAARQLQDDDDDGDDNSSNDASLQRSRALLLQSCWERAVHMANVTLTANINAPETRVEQQQQQQSSSSGKATISPSQPLVRTRSMAEHACQRWNLRPHHEVGGASSATTAIDPGDQQKYMCSVCRNVYASEDQLKEHFYGTTSTSGCCWVGIAYARRQFIRTVMANEVDTQRRLLLQVLLAQPPSSSNDAFGVLDTLDEVLRNSAAVPVQLPPSSNTRPIAVVSETLQVTAHLPPLMLNHNVLESARHRIVDRYTTVRR
jgi:hypothetical protein